MKVEICGQLAWVANSLVNYVIYNDVHDKRVQQTIPHCTSSQFNQLISNTNYVRPNIEARILFALNALQNDPELSLRRAASIYQVLENRGIPLLFSIQTVSLRVLNLEFEVR